MKTSRNCTKGYLTKECANCDLWGDGTQKEFGYAVGCCTKYPIDWCEHFKKMMQEDKEFNNNGKE